MFILCNNQVPNTNQLFWDHFSKAVKEIEDVAMNGNKIYKSMVPTKGSMIVSEEAELASMAAPETEHEASFVVEGTTQVQRA